MKIRVGMGYDVHQLVEGRDLWMGGIKIDHSKGLLGHSDADVLLHVIDISNPEWPVQARIVDDLIAQLGAEQTPCLRVFNKCDAYLGILPHGGNAVCLSAATGEGTDELVRKLLTLLERGKKQLTLHIPYTRAGLIDTLQREAAVTSLDYTDEGIVVEAVVPNALYGKLTEFIPGYTEPKEDWE